MKAQQAALSGTSILLQHSFRDAAFHTESKKIHSNKGGINDQRNQIAKKVIMMLNGDENRFCIIHPITPTSVRGGGNDGCLPASYVSAILAIDHLSTRAVFLLYQFIKPEISKETTRYVRRTIIIVSISLPVCIKVMPPTVATTSM